MTNKLKLLVPIATVCIMLAGCSLTDKSEQNIEEIKTEFCAHTQKIRAKVTAKNVGEAAVFEGYIDSQGNGSGLIEVGDVVRNVDVANGSLIITIFDKIYSVADIGPYFSFDALDKVTADSNKVTIEGGKISGLSGVYGDISFVNKYQEVEDTFEKQVFTIDETLSMEDLISLLSQVNSEKSDVSDAVGLLTEEPEETEEVEPVVEKEPSFYAKSPLGISIDGEIYSIGDKVNADDYYKSFVPEGISFDYVWDSDEKIETQTVSYLDTTGKVTVMTIDDIVFEISATTEFSFLQLTKGQDLSEVKEILGIGLNKKELENFTPMYEGLEVTSNSSKEIVCKLGDLTIKFGIKDKKLYSVFISQDRGYLHYDS